MRKPIKVQNPYNGLIVDVEPLMKLIADNGNDLPDELTKAFINILATALQVQSRLINLDYFITPEEDDDSNDRPNIKDYRLTPREEEVFQYVAHTDLTNREISEKLFISQSTVKSHIKSITEKTGVVGKVGIKGLKPKPRQKIEYEDNPLKETVFTILEICTNKRYR